MNYQIIYCAGTSTGSLFYGNPSPELIDNCINELIPVKDRFVILEPSKRVNGFTLLQVIMNRHPGVGLLYWVEARLVDDEGNWEQYGLDFSDIEEVKKMFRLFAHEVTPDISSWENITEQLQQELLEKKQKKSDGDL